MINGVFLVGELCFPFQVSQQSTSLTILFHFLLACLSVRQIFVEYCYHISVDGFCSSFKSKSRYCLLFIIEHFVFCRPFSRHKTFVLIQERKAIEFEASDIGKVNMKIKIDIWIGSKRYFSTSHSSSCFSWFTVVHSGKM